MAKVIYTIGHSTHTTRHFMKMLKSFGIELLVDVRHYPGSRYCPQFGKVRLRNSLLRNGIDYLHLLSLGGRRRVNKEMTLNMGWRSLQFRGYADYMQTQDFKEGLKELIQLAKEKKVAIMCSEAVPWRCHRSLIADALLARKLVVEDIFDVNKSKNHRLTSFAKVKGRKVIYPDPLQS